MRTFHKRYMLIGNPVAGRGNGIKVFQAATKIFGSRGLDFTSCLTEGPGDAAKITEEGIDNHDIIIGIGGDGTLNEIIRGLRLSGKPLGVIPAGSGNDFAKCLNLPGKLDDIVGVIQDGPVITADAGRFDDIYFINGVGIGFDAAVNQATKKITRLRGFSAYFWAMIKTLSAYKPIRLRITVGVRTVEKETFLVAIGNGSACGGGFRLNPFAKIDDKLLDINILDPISIPVLLWHLPKVFLGTIGKTRYANMSRAAVIEIESRTPFPVHIDGEFYMIGEGKHTVEILPAALKVIGNF